MAASEAYLKLLEQMRDLHIRKSAGYAGAENADAFANFRRCAEFGVDPAVGVLVRMSDKWSRLVNLMRSADNEQVGESIKDTAIDLSAYALMFVCLLEERKQ